MLTLEGKIRSLGRAFTNMSTKGQRKKTLPPIVIKFVMIYSLPTPHSLPCHPLVFHPVMLGSVCS
jgi:hypothetical protein